MLQKGDLDIKNKFKSLKLLRLNKISFNLKLLESRSKSKKAELNIILKFFIQVLTLYNKDYIEYDNLLSCSTITVYY